MNKILVAVGLTMMVSIQNVGASSCAQKVIKEEGKKSYIAKLLLDRCKISDKRESDSVNINIKNKMISMTRNPTLGYSNMSRHYTFVSYTDEINSKRYR